jgi:hypothetical protein
MPMLRSRARVAMRSSSAGAVPAADGAFEGDGADLYGEAPFLGDVDGGENLVVGGRSLVGCEGDEVEAAEDLGGVALVEVEVALFLDEDMVVLTREQADGEVVGERAGGEEGGVLFAEHGGDGGLELVDGAVGEVDVADVGGLLEELGELLGAAEGGDGDSVADESYGAVRDRRDGSSGSLRGLAKQHRGGLQQAEAGGGGRRRGEEVAAIELHAALFRVRMRSTKVSLGWGGRLGCDLVFIVQGIGGGSRETGGAAGSFAAREACLNHGFHPIERGRLPGTPTAAPKMGVPGFELGRYVCL